MQRGEEKECLKCGDLDPGAKNCGSIGECQACPAFPPRCEEKLGSVSHSVWVDG